MEYLQYIIDSGVEVMWGYSFKPCYKWNTFNTNKLNRVVKNYIMKF